MGEGEKERAAGAERLKLANGRQDGQAQSSSGCRQLRTASDAPDLWQLPPLFLPSVSLRGFCSFLRGL